MKEKFVNVTIGCLSVKQRLSDGFFNATDFMKQKGCLKYDINHFASSKDVKNYMSAIMLNSKGNSLWQHPFDLDEYYMKYDKHTKSYYLSPFLFPKFALWIDGMIDKVQIAFIFNSLVSNRRRREDSYKMFISRAIQLDCYDEYEVRNAMYHIAFNNSITSLFDANDSELDYFFATADNLSFCLMMGLIDSYKELIEVMRKIYINKNLKF